MKASLRLKIVSGFVVAALAALVIGLIGGRSVGDVRDQDARAARQSTDQVGTVHALQLNLVQGHLAVAMTLYGPQTGRAASAKNLATTAVKATEILAKLGKTDLSPKARASQQKLTTYFSTYNKAYSGILGVPLPIPDPNAPPVVVPGDTEVETYAKVDVLNANIAKAANDLQTQITSDAAAARKAASDHASRSLTLLLWIAAGIGLVIVAFGTWFSGRIVRRVRRTAQVLERVAEGDLTPRVVDHGSDEVAEMGVALNTTLDTVHDVIREIESDAERLSGYADRMAGSLDELSEYNRLMSESMGKQGLDQVTKSNDTMMAESRETANKLAEMAGGLNAMISIFTLRPQGDAPAEAGSEEETVGAV